jgi:hypothetical protein
VLGGALAGLAAPALAACTGLPLVDPAPPPVPPDVLAADRAADRERRLLAAYDAALVIAPQLADRLLPVRGDHAAHLAALGLPETVATEVDPGTAPPAEPAADPAAEPTGDPAAAPAPPPEVRAPALPQDPTALLAALAELERRAATAHAGEAVRSGRGVGAVLASLSASEASHAAALT